MSGDRTDPDEIERRLNLAAEVIAEGLLNVVLAERRAELEALDREQRERAEAHEQTSAGRIPVAPIARTRRVSTSRDKSPAAR